MHQARTPAAGHPHGPMRGTMRARGLGEPHGPPPLAAAAAAGAGGGGAEEEEVGGVRGGERRRPGLRGVVPAVGAACLGSLCFGYHLAVVNGPLEAIAAALGLRTAAAQGLVVSSVLLGAAAGSFVGGSLANAAGRRTALVYTAAPLVLGAALSAAAWSLAAMVAGRALVGLGIGECATGAGVGSDRVPGTVLQRLASCAGRGGLTPAPCDRQGPRRPWCRSTSAKSPRRGTAGAWGA